MKMQSDFTMNKLDVINSFKLRNIYDESCHLKPNRIDLHEINVKIENPILPTPRLHSSFWHQVS